MEYSFLNWNTGNQGKLKLFIFRKCEKCERHFATERGLKNHITRNSYKPCGIYASIQRRKHNKAVRDKRNQEIKTIKFKSLGSLRALAKQATRPMGKPLTLEEKKSVLRIFDATLEENKELKNLNHSQSRLLQGCLELLQTQFGIF